MTADTEPGLRADARRNRDQIIAAAKEVFAEQGPEVPMEEIARRAGVGVGTLYRRFPERAALIRAVAQANFSAVLAEARAAAVEEPTAWRALERLVGRSGELRLSVQLSLISPLALQVMQDDAETARFRTEILALLDDFVRAAQAEGSLRDDVGTGDVALTMSLLLMLRLPTTTDDETAELHRARILALLFDGLRPGGSALPGNPVTAREIQP